MSVPVNSPRPLSEINTTPLIDVLLVLLVMLVITIPVASHSLDVDLPQCSAPCTAPEPDPVRNRLTIDAADRLLWNGLAIEEDQLAAALGRTRELAVEPELQFAPEAGASYAVAARTMRTIKASGVTKFGFVGNERFRDFAI